MVEMNVEEWRAMGGNSNPALRNVHVTSPQILKAEEIQTIEKKVLGQVLTGGTGTNIEYAKPILPAKKTVALETSGLSGLGSLSSTTPTLGLDSLAGLTSEKPMAMAAVSAGSALLSAVSPVLNAVAGKKKAASTGKTRRRKRHVSASRGVRISNKVLEMMVYDAVIRRGRD